MASGVLPSMECPARHELARARDERLEMIGGRE